MSSGIKFKETEIGMIPEYWEVKKINQVTDQIFSGGTPDTRKSEYWDGNIPWLSSGETRNTFISKTEKKITELGVKNSSTRLAKAEDVVVASAGQGYTRGQTSFCMIDTYINQSVVALRANKEKLKPLFLFYNLVSRYNELRRISDAHSSRGSLTTKLLADLYIQIPPIREQTTISKVLSDLDLKIALNRSMNSTLEAIGQALFKHWFVDFEFPNEEGKPYRSSGGEMVETELGGVPAGWEVMALSKIAEFTRGFSYAGSEKSKVAGDYVFITLNSVYEGGGFKREFSYLTSERLKERHLIKEGEIIIANTEQTKTGTLLGFPALVEFPPNYDKKVGVFSHHITKVIPFGEEFKHFLYYYLNFHQSNAVKYHTGSVIWALDVNGWTNNEKIILPKKEILITFSELINRLFQRRVMNNRESSTLENIRDALLPKLMSGEIRIEIPTNKKKVS